MCDCIKNLEEKLTTRMLELNSGSEVVENVSMNNKSLDSASGELKLFAPYTGRLRKAGRSTKIDDRLIFTYCPFCGEKY